LDDPEFAFLDFQQYFVAGSKPSNCIHGEGECVVHRHFVCAQNMSGTEFPTFRANKQWLAFQNCAYGPCDGSAAIEGPKHPCKTYTTLGQFEKNDIMKNCSAKVGLDWAALNHCGDTAQSQDGQTLMEASAAVSAKDKVHYGLEGLPVVHVAGLDTAWVRTKQLIPIVCGPTPTEVLDAICSVRVKTHTVPSCCQDKKCVRKTPL
jgi:hypothetical protein